MLKSEDISIGRISKCLTEGCNHASRDHNRSKKLKSGHWTGPCQIPDCNCKMYLNNEIKDSLENGVFMGIHNHLEMMCGCIKKSYAGGQVVIQKNQTCTLHSTTKYYECRANNCKFKTISGEEMRKHRWTHAL